MIEGKSLAMLLVLTFAIGCGTEPTADIVGTWSLTSSTSGGGIACTAVAILTVEQSGASITGSLAEQQVSCTEAGQTLPVQARTRAIVGEVSGRDISFTTQVPEGGGDCAFDAFDGRVTGGAMSGAVENRAVFCQGTFVQMRGTWQGQRQ
jgi:hypothetical protein